ncbi:MAG: hypothetical protein ABJN69_05645 [Hellea sp.]
MILENDIYLRLPLDYKSISDKILNGCNQALLKYLLERFWVTDDTDLNDDLGFVFLLKSRSDATTENDYQYKLYLSCVLDVATLRKYKFLNDENSWIQISIDGNEEFSSDMLAKPIIEKLSSFGYIYLNSTELRSGVSDRIKNKLNSFDGNYFNLLFTEY